MHVCVCVCVREREQPAIIISNEHHVCHGSKSSNGDIYFNRNVECGLVNKLGVQGNVCACACGDTKAVSPLLLFTLFNEVLSRR